MNECNEVLASCICKENDQHPGDHICPCGGSWDQDGTPMAWPGSNPSFVWGAEWDDDDLALLEREGA